MDDEVVVRSIVEIPVARCFGSEFNPRSEMTDIAALVRSMEADGQTSPIVAVRRDDGDGRWYEVLAGHRRLEAMRRMGRERIKAEVYDDFDEAMKVSLLAADNFNRVDLDGHETLRMVQTMLDVGASPKVISDTVGEEPQRVAKVLKALGAGADARVETMSMDRAFAMADVAGKLTRDERLWLEGTEDDAEFKRRVRELSVQHRAAELVEAERERLREEGFEGTVLDGYPDTYTSNVGGKPIGPEGCGCPGFACVLVSHGYGDAAERHWICLDPIRHEGDAARAAEAVERSKKRTVAEDEAGQVREALERERAEFSRLVREAGDFEEIVEFFRRKVQDSVVARSAYPWLAEQDGLIGVNAAIALYETCVTPRCDAFGWTVGQLRAAGPVGGELRSRWLAVMNDMIELGYEPSPFENQLIDEAVEIASRDVGF